LISTEPMAAPIGGYSRVGQEQEQSQKVKLSLDAMRPDRRLGARVRLMDLPGCMRQILRLRVLPEAPAGLEG
jgi:hypothetical protein